MAEKVLLKELLFNKSKVVRIADEIHRVYPLFDRHQFIQGVVGKFPELELKARISWIAECLKVYLPQNFHRAVNILIKALPAPNNPDLSDDDFGDFIYASYSEYVVKNGCTKEHLKLSLNALYELTQRFSAEDAIRYFINAYPDETIQELLKWTKDSHYHVRRLCSEGTRPRLPWSQKIDIPITEPLRILDNLFADRTRFVTRSVANHINDISKIDPDLAIDILTKWKSLDKQKLEEMDYMIRHGLRSLVKQGHPKAMKMLGFSHEAQVEVSRFLLPKEVLMNTALEFSLTIKSQKDIKVIVDYTLYFQSKAGKLNSKKVFKLTQLNLLKNKSIAVSKHHMLKERMTTRTLYPGKHEIEIQINGKVYGKKSFLLRKS